VIAKNGTVEVFIASAREALRAGNYLLCYDIVDQARQLGVHDRRLEYVSLLALANAGSTEFAWRRYQLLGLREDEIDEDWLALQGRLLKDLALVGGATEDFRRSAQAYVAAFNRTGGYFTGINAATMFLLGGDPVRAQELAREVLVRAAAARPAGDSERYYLLVSEAEAALLLGDVRRCRQALASAEPLERRDSNARSRTRKQLRMVCRHLGIREDVARDLSLPALLYIGTADEIRVSPGGGYGPPARLAGPAIADVDGARTFAALLQPADLCAAEHFAAQGARLHLVLPTDPEQMVATWRHEYGEGWAGRLSRFLDEVTDTAVAQGFLEHEQRWASRYVGAIAMGMAQLTAQQMGTPCRQIEVARSARSDGDNANLELRDVAAGTLPAAPNLQAAPPERELGTQRRFVGLLFADIAGFRRLRDAEMPRFWSQVMGGIGLVIAAFGDKVLFKHTWGDAVNVITEDAATAAEVAQAIRDCIDEVRRSETGTLAEIELRMSCHFAPAFAGFDPIEHVPTFYGSQLSLAARIEPVTPPGMIFVTEAFAACLSLEAPGRYALEYAGEVELAKRFGKTRLFGLLPADRHGWHEPV
jgi:class 3 adenylate cyclase